MPFPGPWIEQTWQAEVTVDQKEIVDVSGGNYRVISNGGSCNVDIKPALDPLCPGIGLPKWLQRSAQHHPRKQPMYIRCDRQNAEFSFDVSYDAIEGFVFRRVLIPDVLNTKVNFKIHKLWNGGAFCRKRHEPFFNPEVTLGIKNFPDYIGVENKQHRTVPDLPRYNQSDKDYAKKVSVEYQQVKNAAN